MRIKQGDIYWTNSESEVSHPCIVIQDNLINNSSVETVVVCLLTTNMKNLSIPGNILLEKDEGGLAKQSIVEVSKITSIKKSELSKCIGTLPKARVDEIFDGIKFIQRVYYPV